MRGGGLAHRNELGEGKELKEWKEGQSGLEIGRNWSIDVTRIGFQRAWRYYRSTVTTNIHQRGCQFHQFMLSQRRRGNTLLFTINRHQHMFSR